MIGRRFVPVLLTLFVLCACTVVADSPARDLLPGDPAPELKIGKWLQKGVYDWVRPVGREERLITVVEFWADWCPLSRAVLPVHDKLAARLRDKGVRFVAVGEGHLDSVQAITKQLGLRNMAVAFDEGEALFDTFLGSRSHVPIPYCVVIEENGRLDRGVVLWHGPAVTYEGSDTWDDGYTTRMEDVLDLVAGGRYEVASAREIWVAKADAQRLMDRVQSVGPSGRSDELLALGREAARKPWPVECSDLKVSILGTASWLLLGTKDHSREQASEALKMLQAAIRLHGKEHPSLLHAQARALFECGQVEAAVAAEQRAMELPNDDDGFSKQDYANALARYKEVLPGNNGKQTAAGRAAPEVAKVEEPKRQEPQPKDTLTSEEAASDLLALHESLHLNYAGYDDIAWRLAGEGNSWQKHNAAFLDRVRARDQWPASDFYGLVNEYLGVARDHHLHMSGGFLRDGKRESWYSHPTNGVDSYFAAVRVRERDGHKVLVEAENGLPVQAGDELADIPVIGSPYAAKTGQVYLFPTLPRQHSSTEYLVGILADSAVPAGNRPKPERIGIAVTSSSAEDKGARRNVELPVHRGRSAYSAKEKTAWSLDLKPVPVLAVRRMWGDGLADMPGTAVTLRDLPVVLVDIRGNGGGSDTWANDWVGGFSKQYYQDCSGILDLRRGETDPLRRWSSRFRGGFSVGAGRPGAADKPYQGRLFILIDNNCCSSGETFAHHAVQIPGTLLAGENTGGFFSYTLGQAFRLPHTDLTVSFGSRKLFRGGRDCREGMGMFPDYWLDEPDPVAAVAAYCSLK